MVSYSTHVKPLQFLKEQLRLYAFNAELPPHDILNRFQRELSKRERLAALLEGELNFHGENSRYASHDLHSLALGTGDLDCVYHFALPELREAVEKTDSEDQLEMLLGMINGRRLRDISDLPFDLAI